MTPKLRFFRGAAEQKLPGALPCAGEDERRSSHRGAIQMRASAHGFVPAAQGGMTSDLCLEDTPADTPPSPSKRNGPLSTVWSCLATTLAITHPFVLSVDPYGSTSPGRPAGGPDRPLLLPYGCLHAGCRGWIRHQGRREHQCCGPGQCGKPRE